MIFLLWSEESQLGWSDLQRIAGAIRPISLHISLPKLEGSILKLLLLSEVDKLSEGKSLPSSSPLLQIAGPSILMAHVSATNMHTFLHAKNEFSFIIGFGPGHFVQKGMALFLTSHLLNMRGGDTKVCQSLDFVNTNLFNSPLPCNQFFRVRQVCI